MKIIWMEYAGQPMICDFSCGDDVEDEYLNWGVFLCKPCL